MSVPQPQRRQIVFKYDGVRYAVDMKAYDLNRIVLPNGKLLEADFWRESLPPQPAGLHEVPHLFQDLEPEQIAEQFNAVVAIEVEIH